MNAPLECIIRKCEIHLERVLSSIRTSCGTTYLHTGDLDYGGVKIFQYIKKRIFP